MNDLLDKIWELERRIAIIERLGGGVHVTPQAVNETPNGSITAFTVSEAYTPGTTMVFLDGLLQERGVDYTESSPEDGEITFTSAPGGSAVILIGYKI